MEKKRYFKNNEAYFKFLNKNKDKIKVKEVYYTKMKLLCIIYNKKEVKQ